MIIGAASAAVQYRVLPNACSPANSRTKWAATCALASVLAAGASCQPSRRSPAPRPDAQRLIVAAAREEVRRHVTYDPSYCVLGYPGGDVPRDRGACTDVVVRALRAAGYDLQKLVHEDMRLRWSAYPHRYGLARPDSNIDHRRVPNLRAYFARHGTVLPVTTANLAAAVWRPGDIVFWKLPGGVLDHCGIVTDRLGPSGLPLVVHNLATAAEEDCLDRWRITAPVRFPTAPGGRARSDRRAAPASPGGGTARRGSPPARRAHRPHGRGGG